MKKLISFLLTALILSLTFCSFIPCVSAADDDDWVLGPYAEYVTHAGKTYKNIRIPYRYKGNWCVSGEMWDLEFADDKTADMYEGSTIEVYEDVEDSIVRVELNSERNGYQNRFYVEETRLQDYEEICQGVGAGYALYDFYDSGRLTLSAQDFDEWLECTTVKMDASSIERYEYVELYACDKLDVLEVECSMILFDYFTDQTYLLNYNDYGSDHFYSDGGFNQYVDKEVTLYELEDEVLKREINKFVNTEPEDELDWLIEDVVNERSALIFCSIVFGVLPFAALVFSLIMCFALKDKKYRGSFAVVAVGSFMVIAAFAVMLLILI